MGPPQLEQTRHFYIAPVYVLRLLGRCGRTLRDGGYGDGRSNGWQLRVFEKYVLNFIFVVLVAVVVAVVTGFQAGIYIFFLFVRNDCRNSPSARNVSPVRRFRPTLYLNDNAFIASSMRVFAMCN